MASDRFKAGTRSVEQKGSKQETPDGLRADATGKSAVKEAVDKKALKLGKEFPTRSVARVARLLEQCNHNMMVQSLFQDPDSATVPLIRYLIKVRPQRLRVGASSPAWRDSQRDIRLHHDRAAQDRSLGSGKTPYSQVRKH